MQTKNKTYFNGLNGLRGIAAVMVLFGHTGNIVFPNGLEYNPIWELLSTNGDHSVSFFFVLSGFLISYLMLEEIQNTRNIQVGKFYLKRVFRIWPIYFLIIVLSQLIIPFVLSKFGMEWKTVSNQSLVYYAVILPNVPYLFFDSGKLFHLWSIGVEEQFYLIWGPLAKWFKNYFLQLCIFIIILKFVILILLTNSHPEGTLKTVLLLLKQFRIEQMCIGAIGAYTLFNFKTKLINHFIFKKPSQIFIYCLLLFFLIGKNYSGQSLISSIYSVLFNNDSGYFLIPLLFLYLLLNISVNPLRLFGMENKILNYMGQISYGFYVYHVISIVVTEFLLHKIGITNDSLKYCLVFYSLAITINTFISTLSYYLFEIKIQKWGVKKFIQPMVNKTR